MLRYNYSDQLQLHSLIGFLFEFIIETANSFSVPEKSQSVIQIIRMFERRHLQILKNKNEERSHALLLLQAIKLMTQSKNIQGKYINFLFIMAQ